MDGQGANAARTTVRKYAGLRVAPGRRLYMAYFHTSRGGCGIEYETAKHELVTVMRPLDIDAEEDTPAYMRMRFSLPADAEGSMVGAARRLGYTEAIVRLVPSPYRGERWEIAKVGRWLVGTQRWGEQLVEFAEVYVEDTAESLAHAPHRRPFLIARDEGIVAVKGERLHRRLSHRDARFLINIAQLPSQARVLDPFAGIGSIVLECRARTVGVVCGDIDATLRPGLAQIADGRAAILDARRLPFGDGEFDAVITEPSYHRKDRPAVVASVPEMARVTAPGGRLVVFVAEDMGEAVLHSAARVGVALQRQFTIRRQGQLRARALLLRKCEVQ